MSRSAIIGSVAIHLAVAALLLWASHQSVPHAATTVSIFQPSRPKAPPPKPKVDEPPKPPAPKPIVKPHEVVTPVAPPPPVPAVTPPPTHSSSKAPVALGGLQFSNDGSSDSGPGLEVGGGAGRPLTPAVPESRLTKRPRPATAAPGEEAPCLEEATKPEPIVKQDIEYTTEARAAGVEGRLVLKVTVGSDGAVAKVDVVSPVDPALDAASVAAATKWRFKPSTRCGKAVAGGVYTLARRFELGD